MKSPLLDYTMMAGFAWENTRKLHGLEKDSHRLISCPNPRNKSKSKHTKMLNRGNVVNDKLKIGRNDPCSCGSGRKYKRCCLGKEAS